MIRYIVFKVEPCRLGDLYTQVLEFYCESDATEFIRFYYDEWDFNFTCLKLLKVIK